MWPVTAVSTLEAEWENSKFKVALGLEASLGYIGPCLKKRKTEHKAGRWLGQFRVCLTSVKV